MDGLNWTAKQINGIGQYLNGALGYDRTTGTWIFIADKYANQTLYRSVDGGSTWMAAGAGQFKGGHPMIDVVAGTIDAAGCP